MYSPAANWYFRTNREGLRLIILRGSDVPTYVQFGAADIGVAGKDGLLEHQGDGYYEPLDLGIARCKLMTAVPVGDQPADRASACGDKIYQRGRQFYAQQGRQADLIKLYGAMELRRSLDWPMRLSILLIQAILLEANGLEAREEIADISSRLIVNKAAMKTKYQRFSHCDALEEAQWRNYKRDADQLIKRLPPMQTFCHQLDS